MRRLAPARRGLSIVDANKGRLIEFRDDVLGVKREIEERWSELSVTFDEWDEGWVIVEHCKDGVDRIVFQGERIKALDRRIVQRLERADQAVHGELDIEAAIDKENEEVEREKDRRFSDQIGDFGERFIFALKKDGFMNHPHISRTQNK